MIGPFEDGNWAKALSLAFRWHAGQTRKNSGLPYVIHCIEVAANLERLGFAEPVVIAGLLHDILEDTEIDPRELAAAFGAEVHEIVAALTETKTDECGAKRPWIDRKRDHVKHLCQSSEAVRGVALADQRQNLASVLKDWNPRDPEFWSAFNASPGDYLDYHRRRLAGCRGEEPGVRELSSEVARLIEELAGRLDDSGLVASKKFADPDWA